MLPVLLGIGRAGAMLARVGASGARAAGATVRVNATRAIKKLEKLTEVPEDVLEHGYDVFYSETPKRTGNAKSRTKLNKNKTRIEANYPYAGRLDSGYSKQSPKGMSEPAQKAMGKYAKRVVMKIDKE